MLNPFLKVLTMINIVEIFSDICCIKYSFSCKSLLNLRFAILNQNRTHWFILLIKKDFVVLFNGG